MRASLVKRSLRTIHSEVPPSLANMYEFEKALAKVSHVVHASWYEVSCGDYKDFTDPTVSSSATSVHDNVGRLSVKSSMYEPRALLRSASFHNVTGDGLTSSMPCSTPSPMHGDAEQTPFSSPCLSLASSCPSPSSSHSTESILRVHMSLGSIVHLRNVVGGRKEDRIQDMLSYSCLAILKAYFTQTEGLLSYTFYRSLDGSRMTGLGVWQNAFAAATFLNAPDGAPEEKYWRSIGAGTRFQIYEVVSLIA
ncbi:hypothetical protein KP509_05G059900 [Ceratopteris richardii]|nr:hypothetical protein KP509_05G059900 [Ceratopteris richardii]